MVEALIYGSFKARLDGALENILWGRDLLWLEVDDRMVEERLDFFPMFNFKVNVKALLLIYYF